MNRFAIVVCMLTAFSVGNAAAQEKKDSMSKDSMAKPMTMQECKDHMAMMQKTDAQKKDAAMMKKDQMCGEMMKGDAMKKDDAPKK